MVHFLRPDAKDQWGDYFFELFATWRQGTFPRTIGLHGNLLRATGPGLPRGHMLSSPLYRTEVVDKVQAACVRLLKTGGLTSLEQSREKTALRLAQIFQMLRDGRHPIRLPAVERWTVSPAGAPLFPRSEMHTENDVLHLWVQERGPVLVHNEDHVVFTTWDQIQSIETDFPRRSIAFIARLEGWQRWRDPENEVPEDSAERFKQMKLQLTWTSEFFPQVLRALQTFQWPKSLLKAHRREGESTADGPGVGGIFRTWLPYSRHTSAKSARAAPPAQIPPPPSNTDSISRGFFPSIGSAKSESAGEMNKPTAEACAQPGSEAEEWKNNLLPSHVGENTSVATLNLYTDASPEDETFADTAARSGKPPASMHPSHSELASSPARSDGDWEDESPLARAPMSPHIESLAMTNHSASKAPPKKPKPLPVSSPFRLPVRTPVRSRGGEHDGPRAASGRGRGAAARTCTPARSNDTTPSRQAARSGRKVRQTRRAAVQAIQNFERMLSDDPVSSQTHNSSPWSPKDESAGSKCTGADELSLHHREEVNAQKELAEGKAQSEKKDTRVMQAAGSKRIGARAWARGEDGTGSDSRLSLLPLPEHPKENEGNQIESDETDRTRRASPSGQAGCNNSSSPAKRPSPEEEEDQVEGYGDPSPRPAKQPRGARPSKRTTWPMSRVLQDAQVHVDPVARSRQSIEMPDSTCAEQPHVSPPTHEFLEHDKEGTHARSPQGVFWGAPPVHGASTHPCGQQGVHGQDQGAGSRVLHGETQRGNDKQERPAQGTASIAPAAPTAHRTENGLVQSVHVGKSRTMNGQTPLAQSLGHDFLLPKGPSNAWEERRSGAASSARDAPQAGYRGVAREFSRDSGIALSGHTALCTAPCGEVRGKEQTFDEEPDLFGRPKGDSTVGSARSTTVPGQAPLYACPTFPAGATAPIVPGKLPGGVPSSAWWTGQMPNGPQDARHVTPWNSLTRGMRGYQHPAVLALHMGLGLPGGPEMTGARVCAPGRTGDGLGVPPVPCPSIGPPGWNTHAPPNMSGGTQVLDLHRQMCAQFPDVHRSLFRTFEVRAHPACLLSPLCEQRSLLSYLLGGN